MSIASVRDPRVTLMREKYFTMRPKPLERWVWKQGMPASAERVYWYHWDLGARNGTWCSQVPLRVVARECCLDPATVTRAYQLLKRLGLVRRQDPGRDPRNPFQQATSVTEVRVPRELLQSLDREPTRRSRAVPSGAEAPAGRGAEAGGTTPAALDRDGSRQVFAKLSAGERSRFASASTHRRATIAFDGDTRLNAIERGHVLATLDSLARARPASPIEAPRPAGGSRRLSRIERLSLENRLQTLSSARGESLRTTIGAEIAFAVEEGALRRFPVPLALNIALKKVREGAWSSPSGMPAARSALRACAELCSGAGGM